MNLQALRDYTRQLLAETNPSESFWLGTASDDPIIDNFINRSYEAVCVAGELLQCTSIGNVIHVPGEVHGEFPYPRDILKVVRVFYRNKKLIDSTIEELDLLDAEWYEKVCQTPDERPTHWATRGQVFHLYPAPGETASQVLKLWCIQTPQPLVTIDQNPEIPTGYHEAIAIGAALRALASDRTSSENNLTIMRFERWFATAVTIAKSQHDRKSRAPTVMRDIRDFYSVVWRP